jgi:hypothetical protein
MGQIIKSCRCLIVNTADGEEIGTANGCNARAKEQMHTCTYDHYCYQIDGEDQYFTAANFIMCVYRRRISEI